MIDECKLCQKLIMQNVNSNRSVDDITVRLGDQDNPLPLGPRKKHTILNK